MEQIESVCNSIEKKQEKGDWQQALQSVKEDDPHLQTNQGIVVVNAKLPPYSVISVTSVLPNVRKVIAIYFHPLRSFSIEKTLSVFFSVCYLMSWGVLVLLKHFSCELKETWRSGAIESEV